MQHDARFEQLPWGLLYLETARPRLVLFDKLFAAEKPG